MPYLTHHVYDCHPRLMGWRSIDFDPPICTSPVWCTSYQWHAKPCLSNRRFDLNSQWFFEGSRKTFMRTGDREKESTQDTLYFLKREVSAWYQAVKACWCLTSVKFTLWNLSLIERHEITRFCLNATCQNLTYCVDVNPFFLTSAPA